MCSPRLGLAGKVGPRHSGAQPPPLPSWACPRVFIQPSGANGSQVSLDLPPPGLSSARARVLWYWGPLELYGGGDPSPALTLVLQPSSASVMVGGDLEWSEQDPPPEGWASHSPYSCPAHGDGGGVPAWPGEEDPFRAWLGDSGGECHCCPQLMGKKWGSWS